MPLWLDCVPMGNNTRWRFAPRNREHYWLGQSEYYKQASLRIAFLRAGPSFYLLKPEFGKTAALVHNLSEITATLPLLIKVNWSVLDIGTDGARASRCHGLRGERGLVSGHGLSLHDAGNAAVLLSLWSGLGMSLRFLESTTKSR